MSAASSKILATRRITTKIMYKSYIKENPDTTLTYNQFKKIVGDTHKEAVQTCIETGGVYYFGHSVGVLRVVKFQMDIRIDEETGKIKGLRPDFGATKKHQANGGTGIIYHKPGLLVRWLWGKKDHQLENKAAWCFVPTDGPKGISRKLSKYVSTNPTVTLHYRESTLKSKEEARRDRELKRKMIKDGKRS